MKNLILLFALVLFACQSEKTNAQNDENQNQEKTSLGSVHIFLEGKSYIFNNLNWKECSATFEDDKIRIYLTEGDIPVSLNFNLDNTGVLEKGSANYTLPDVNRGEYKVAVDLNFFDKNRDVEKRIRKRLVFRKGKIDIRQFSKDRLEMTFEGEGGPMLSSESFPIRGSINIKINQ